MTSSRNSQDVVNNGMVVVVVVGNSESPLSCLLDARMSAPAATAADATSVFCLPEFCLDVVELENLDDCHDLL